MNPKYRYFYLSIGLAGLILLFYQIISTLPEIDPVRILVSPFPIWCLCFWHIRRIRPRPRQKPAEAFRTEKFPIINPLPAAGITY